MVERSRGNQQPGGGNEEEGVNERKEKDVGEKKERLKDK